MMRNMVQTWGARASDLLEGRTIVRARYATDDEMRKLYWLERGIILELDDGTFIFPARDDEGNGPGALFTNHDALPVVPVIGE